MHGTESLARCLRTCLAHERIETVTLYLIWRCKLLCLRTCLTHERIETKRRSRPWYCWRAKVCLAHERIETSTRAPFVIPSRIV